jgi:hypothetical protein
MCFFVTDISYAFQADDPRPASSIEADHARFYVMTSLNLWMCIPMLCWIGAIYPDKADTSSFKLYKSMDVRHFTSRPKLFAKKDKFLFA